MKENHDSAKVRFNPRKLRSVFRRKQDAECYLEFRGWKQQADGLFTGAFMDEVRRIENRGKNNWVIIA